MNKAFSNFTWEDDPSVNTPLSSNNLNKVNSALDTVDTRVVQHETTKANQTDMLTAITGVSLDESTGVFTFTRHNGTTVTIDTRLEKVIMNWNFDSTTQILYLILQDGTEMPVDLSAFITNVEFKDSTTIRSVLNDDGTVSFEIIDGSITGDKLEPNYLANVQLASSSASQSAESAESSALRAEAAAEKAESVSDVGIATTEIAGIVKPDGITITISSDGTISAQTSSGGGITEEELNTILANYLPLDGSLTTNYNKVSDLNNFYSGIGLFTSATANMPSGFVYGLVIAGSAGSGTVIQVAFDLLANNGAKQRRCASNAWKDWEPFKAEYLPITGGTITGELNQIVDTAAVVRRQKNSVREIQEYLDSNGSYSLVDVTNNKAIIVSNKDGTTTANLTASGNIKYTDKPTGTYTGNGSTTARTISTGGVGNMLVIYTDDMQTQAIVTPRGAFTFENNEVNLYEKTEIYYENGSLYLANSEVVFNKSGTTYTYHCI